MAAFHCLVEIRHPNRPSKEIPDDITPDLILRLFVVNWPLLSNCWWTHWSNWVLWAELCRLPPLDEVLKVVSANITALNLISWR